MYKTDELFELEKTLAGEYLARFAYPWEALSGICEFIVALGQCLDKNEYRLLKENVWVHQSAVVSSSACIGSPCIIGRNTEIKHCAFIRGAALIGDNCVVGNSTEIKNSILFDGVRVPHFNYIGDSILGHRVHLGAGAVTSNVKSDKSLVAVKEADKIIETGLKKFGAIIGDGTEIGCNAVLNPGTVAGKNVIVYPLSSVRGVIPSGCIFKSPDNIVVKG